MALADNADLSTPFSVSFIWLGSTEPHASQQFEIYDENFNIVTSGMTSAQIIEPVPEPKTLLLFYLGIIAIVGINRKITI